MLIRWQKTIVDQRGNVQPGAVLTVRRESDQALVRVYRDRNGANPYPTGTVTADENGYAYFYALPGSYRITSLKPAIDWRDEGLTTAIIDFAGRTYVTIDDLEADTSAPVGTLGRVSSGEGAGDYVMTATGWEWSDVQPATQEEVAGINAGLAATDARLTNANAEIAKVQIEALGQLRRDLQNPLRSVNLRLVGDSITWGSGASGTSPYEPRNGTLSDPRNTISAATSPTWANLLRRWLAGTFAGGELIQDAPGSGYSVGNNPVDLFALQADSFVWRNPDGTELTPAQIRAAAVSQSLSETGKYLDIVVSNLNFPKEFQFETSATELEIIYATATSGTPETREITVYVDGEVHTTFSSHGSSATWNNRVTVILDGALHTVRIRNTGDFNWRMQGMNATRRIKVANDGIVGSSTNTWLTHVTLTNSIQATDSHVFVQLGTNDRITSVNNSLYGLVNRLSKIVSDIRSMAPNADVTLLSANAVTQNEGSGSSYSFDMRTVDSVVRDVAANTGCGFVSQYALTLQDKYDGVDITPDGLHPGDATQRRMFENIRQRLQVS